MDRKPNAALLQRWIVEEIELSEACAQPAPAQIHRKIAALYADQLSELRSRAPIVEGGASSARSHHRGAARAAREKWGRAMGKESEIDYLARRAGEELDVADSSRDASVAHIHRQMAVAYAERVAGLRAVMPVVIDIRSAMAQPST